MRKLKTCFVGILLFNLCTVVYSQGLSAGLLSGINISDIHGNYCSGKWKFKPGASESIFIDYSLNKVLGFETGIGITTLYYERIPYYSTPPPIIYPFSSLSSYYIPDLIYFPQKEKMDFTFVTLPLQVKISVPAKPSVYIKAGVMYSFLSDYSLVSFYADEPVKRDFGYLFSTGLLYPLNDNMDALLDVRYMAGEKRFLEHAGYKHGSLDFRFGFALRGFLQEKNDTDRLLKADSVSRVVSLTYTGGINLSHNYFNHSAGSYSFYAGYSAGFNVDLKLSERVFFRTGLSFERTGYSLKDSSSSYHRQIINIEPVYYVNTKIVSDYFVIPAQLAFRLGKPGNIYIGAGPYIAVKLNARCTGEAFEEYSNNSTYYYQEITVYDDLGRLICNNDFGWLLTGGVTMPVFRNYSVDLGLHYQIGIMDIFNESFYQNLNQAERGETIIRNRVLSLRIGIKVPVYR